MSHTNASIQPPVQKPLHRSCWSELGTSWIDVGMDGRRVRRTIACGFGDSTSTRGTYLPSVYTLAGDGFWVINERYRDDGALMERRPRGDISCTYQFLFTEIVIFGVISSGGVDEWRRWYNTSTIPCGPGDPVSGHRVVINSAGRM